MTAPKEKGSVSIYVYVPENTENFKEDVTLRDRKSHEQYELTDDGAVICEKTASLIGVKQETRSPWRKTTESIK